jgi:hypothetical protein
MFIFCLHFRFNEKKILVIAAFLSVVLITEMLEICIQTSYDQHVQLILKSYLPVVYGTPLNIGTAPTVWYFFGFQFIRITDRNINIL